MQAKVRIIWFANNLFVLIVKSNNFIYPKRLVAPQGCDDCSGVAFCSVECKKIACSTYHKFECKFMDLLIGSGMSILCYLALRLIVQSMTPELALKNGRKVIADLCTHSNRRSNDDYLQRCTMTAFLLRVLQKAEFFGRRTTESGNIVDTMCVCSIRLNICLFQPNRPM